MTVNRGDDLRSECLPAMRTGRGGEGHLCVGGSDLCLDWGEQGEVVGASWESTAVHRTTRTRVNPCQSLTGLCCNDIRGFTGNGMTGAPDLSAIFATSVRLWLFQHTKHTLQHKTKKFS